MSSYSSSLKNRLDNGFASFGYALAVKENYLIVEKSQDVRRAKVAHIVESMGFNPLISDERLEGNIVFTLTPFEVPPFFKVVAAGERALFLIREQIPFWNKRGNAAFRLATWANTSNKSEVTWQFKKVVDGISPGMALDLGCGSGEKSKYLLDRGWTVDGVESCPQFIKQLKGASDKLHLHQTEVEAFPFTKKYDLIVAHGILYYTDPEKFPLLWDNLYGSLNENGLITGTFVKMVHQPELYERLTSVGTWFVEDINHVKTLLSERGYKNIECGLKRFPDGVVCSAEFEFSAQRIDSLG